MLYETMSQYQSRQFFRGAYRAIGVGQSPDADFCSVDIHEKLSDFGIWRDQLLEREGSITFLVKVQGILFCGRLEIEMYE